MHKDLLKIGKESTRKAFNAEIAILLVIPLKHVFGSFLWRFLSFGAYLGPFSSARKCYQGMNLAVAVDSPE